MADVSVQMGVSGISQFKSGMAQAQASVKTLDAALKVNEKQYKATGNAQDYMQQKATLLQNKLSAQKNALAQAEAALKTMADNGVDPLSTAYQKMQQSMLAAQAAVLDTQSDIDSLGTESESAAGKTDELASSLAGINKKANLDLVTSGIGKITDALDSAVSKAVSLASSLWDSMMDAASWGDDIATQATIAQMSVEDYQRTVNVAATSGETSTSDLIKSWKKIKMNLTSDSADIIEAFDALGVARDEVIGGGKEGNITKARDYMDVYWEIGEALLNMEDAALQETYAQKLLGRSWEQSLPMFVMGREAYEEAWNSQSVVSEKTVGNLAGLNDTLTGLSQEWNTLTTELLGTIAPALTDVGEVLKGVLKEVNDYLKSDEGKEKLKEMSDSISSLFTNLADIDPESLVSGFVTTFDSLVDGLKWIKNNSGAIKTALETILGVFIAGKLLGAVTTITNLITGLGGLAGGTATAATAAGASGLTGGLVGGGTGSGLGLLGGLGIQNALLGTGFSMMGGLSTFLPLGAMAAMGIAGWNMVQANLSDPNLQQIYGKGNVFLNDFTEGGVMDTMNDEQWRAALAYYEIFRDQSKWGTEEAFSARDTLFNLLEQGGYTNTEDAVSLLESVWTNMALENESDTVLQEKFKKKLAEMSGDMSEEPPEVTVKTVPEEGSKEAIEEAVGIPEIQVRLHPVGFSLGGIEFELPGHANGLPFVPFDGYMAMLHKGERVVPANQNGSGGGSFSSNMYIESMYMNNGQDAEGLAAAMAAAMRREMYGYGSN